MRMRMRRSAHLVAVVVRPGCLPIAMSDKRAGTHIDARCASASTIQAAQPLSSTPRIHGGPNVLADLAGGSLRHEWKAPSLLDAAVHATRALLERVRTHASLHTELGDDRLGRTAETAARHAVDQHKGRRRVYSKDILLACELRAERGYRRARRAQSVPTMAEDEDNLGAVRDGLAGGLSVVIA
eukprot:scaffold7659_cov140-Isochrysis_galbana.AAC.2